MIPSLLFHTMGRPYGYYIRGWLRIKGKEWSSYDETANHEMLWP